MDSSNAAVLSSYFIINISTSSTLAPNVTLSFNLLAPGSYSVFMISNVSGTTIVLNNVSSTGTVNVTYDPATMPLDPVFEVSPSVVPPPPYNPVQPKPPSDFFPAYIFYILLAVSAVGVAIGVYILVRRPR